IVKQGVPGPACLGPSSPLSLTDSATAACLRFPVRAVDFLTSAAFAVFLTFECGSVALPDDSLGGTQACALQEEKQEATVLASHTLPNSLVYGADWSWLLFHSLQRAPSWSSPSNLGTKTADLKGAGELPTPCHGCTENSDGAGHARPQSGMKPLTERMRKNGTWLQATAATTRDCGVNLEEADSTFSLLATCSFYDHALHLWEWEGNRA
ncbi:diphthine methyltransferase-like, partial [Theropithecus gelada]|uniref:diphthine methyltransferase-like n=1 Tax=Theropithecus gelada TaxID=9565 RepID=UPI000DC1B5F8